MFSLFSQFNKVFSMPGVNQIHNTKSAQSFFYCYYYYYYYYYYFLSPCRTNTSTVYIQVPKIYNSLNEWMDGWIDGGREGRTNERTND